LSLERAKDIIMKRIFLNRWGLVFHAILTSVTEDEDRVLVSRVCSTLQEAHRLIEGWQLQHGIAAQDIRDNSRLDLNELLAGIETDFRPANN
jgi:hypothetical protein